jgi:hypothetical protein
MAAGWAAMHVNGLHDYPMLVKAATAGEGDDSYSVYAVLTRLGAPAPLLIADILGVVVLFAVCVLARRDDRASFVAALAASLALTPILWVNSFSLLLIPLCLASRRLSWWWTVPVVLWFIGDIAYGAPFPSVVLVWGLAALTLGSLSTRRVPQPVTAGPVPAAG